MRTSITTLLLLFGILAYGQDLKCEDFRTGTFKNITDNGALEWEVIRQADSQVEILTKGPQEVFDAYEGKQTRINIEWVDECNYRLTAAGTDEELDDIEKQINAAGGVLTELIKIEGKCYHYKATCLVLNDEIVVIGKLCKVEEL